MICYKSSLLLDYYLENVTNLFYSSVFVPILIKNNKAQNKIENHTYQQANERRLFAN